MSTRNFYEILNSTPAASVDELRSNYKQLILQCHPDKLQQPDKQSTNCNTSGAAAATKVGNAANALSTVTVGADPNAEIAAADMSDDFVAINEAWNTLKDAAKRRLYDAELLLTKFQAHNNVYARLKLADMKRCAAMVMASDSENEEVVVDGKESEMPTVPTKAIHYYYTYDCRCGGQYIVDESADSEILNRNGKHNRKQQCSTSNSNCNNSDNNCTAGDNDATSSEGVAVAAAAGEGADVVDVDDNNDDVLVECSECSLVIVLN